MGLFNKLANILFDEEEEEIPVITKENKKEEKEKERNTFDDVVITKIDTKVEEKTSSIPKFSEEVKTETKKFTFPFMDDDEDEEELTVETRSSNTAPTKSVIDFSYANRAPELPKEPSKKSFWGIEEKKKEKSDAYTASRNNIYDTSKDEKKPFTLSPIISPVYGILNENYTKDDIVEKNSGANRRKAIDFDSVRRKAYGTLEDEIEVSLTKGDDILDEVPEKEGMTIDTLKDDGLSINDLLVSDDENDEKTRELFRVEEMDNEENVYDDDNKEIIDEEENDNNEEDLFDLIDSIYSREEE